MVGTIGVGTVGATQAAPPPATQLSYVCNAVLYCCCAVKLARSDFTTSFWFLMLLSMLLL